jgi:nucleoside phosphorylase
MPLDDPIGVDLARRIYDYGLTPEDLGPRLHGRAAETKARRALELPWPATLTPTPAELAVEPDPADPLPRADVLVVTWTIAEMLALADVLTPGVNPRTRWYRYDRFFDSYRPKIRAGAPAQMAQRLASYYMTRIGSKRVLCVKSELHPNQDGVKTGAGTATLPLADLLKQVYAEVRPRLVITVGTAGGTLPTAELGDVMITRAAKFRCAREFRNEPFNGRTYVSTARVPTKHLAKATELLQIHAAELQEPDFGPPTKFYDVPGPLVPGHTNTPGILIEGRDFARGLPMLTTDFFEFGTSANGLEAEGCGVEMGDAVFGLVAEELGAAAPKWLVIRNASDPQINGDLPAGPPSALNMQAHWAVWYYEAFGYWTSVNSAIATWAVIAG